MKKLSLKRFTNHIFLKRVGRDLLDQFFERYPDLPADSTLRTAHAALDYYSALAACFMRPERLPPALIEDLLAIEEMSTPDGLARLERSPDWPRLQPQLRPDSTAEDIALQIWLIAPEVLAREHNTLRIRRLTSFEHAAHPCANHAIRNTQHVSPPERAIILNLTMALDVWFARHQRGAETTRIEVYPLDDDLWFLIRHGDLFKRIAKVDRQRTDTLHFRPRRDDVAVLSWRLNELRVNARTQAERDLYVREFGAHLYGDPNYFSERRPYTLDPLRYFGRDALDPDGLEGIRNIRLCKLAVRFENSLNEVLIREADDLFACSPIWPFQRSPVPEQGALERALFEIQFTGSLKAHPVEIRVPNVLKLGRRCDPEAVQNWLCARGFRRPYDRVQDPVYSDA